MRNSQIIKAAAQTSALLFASPHAMLLNQHHDEVCCRSMHAATQTSACAMQVTHGCLAAARVLDIDHVSSRNSAYISASQTSLCGLKTLCMGVRHKEEQKPEADIPHKQQQAWQYHIMPQHTAFKGQDVMYVGCSMMLTGPEHKTTGQRLPCVSVSIRQPRARKPNLG